jgi:hypothetical protein
MAVSMTAIPSQPSRDRRGTITPGTVSRSGADEPWPLGGALGPAAWGEHEWTGSGSGLGAGVRVEDALPNRVLRAGLAICGAQQREAAAFSVHGVLPSRKRHVSPSIATLPHTEAAQSLEGTTSGFEDHSASASFPGGLPRSFGTIFTDTTSPLPLDTMGLHKTPRALETALATFARVGMTRGTRVGRRGQCGACVDESSSRPHRMELPCTTR